jgi:hypothetical protein
MMACSSSCEHRPLVSEPTTAPPLRRPRRTSFSLISLMLGANQNGGWGYGGSDQQGFDQPKSVLCR